MPLLRAVTKMISPRPWLSRFWLSGRRALSLALAPAVHGTRPSRAAKTTAESARPAAAWRQFGTSLTTGRVGRRFTHQSSPATLALPAVSGLAWHRCAGGRPFASPPYFASTRYKAAERFPAWPCHRSQVVHSRTPLPNARDVARRTGVELCFTSWASGAIIELHWLPASRCMCFSQTSPLP